VLKKDCLDLPEEMPDEVITIPFNPAKNKEPFNKTSYDLYCDALESYVEALDLVSDNPLTRLLRLRQVATGHIKEADTRDENGKPIKGKMYALNNDKTKYCLELIENNMPNKTVVFYQFTASCHSLEKALDKAKIKYLTLNGDTKDKQCWKKFQSDDSIKVFIVHYQSGASAIDLFASSYTIYYEPTNSSNIYEQSRARTHRNGQKQSCNYIHLLTENTIEETMYQTLLGHNDFTEEAYREIARLKLKEK
jgi:SNF2 family DNA or RNA helicase